MTVRPPLLCTVRNCGRRLIPEARTWRCEQGHAFDVARDGYLNLLQPQDRRSRHAGDSRQAVEARAALLASGVGRANLQALVSHAAGLTFASDPPVVIDLGCGSGEALAMLADATRISAVGIDLSTDAVSLAARRFGSTLRTRETAAADRSITWVVANADRGLPLADQSVSLVLSIQGRRNPEECRRVLGSKGWLLVSVPAPDDLIELRELVQGVGEERDRVDDLVREHAAFFRVVERRRVAEHHTLDRKGLLDLLRGTYRGNRAGQSMHLDSVDRLPVTIASEVLLFAPVGRT